MALKKLSPPVAVPESPDKLLYDLPRRKIKGLIFHQGEILKAYSSIATNKPDVALQLPTGSGKTLVGLLIAEWRRRHFREKTVYLCPTNQLVHQVVELANEQYGLTVHGFTGSIATFAPEAKASYQSAESIAITSFSSLFNTNPFFNNPQTIIVDDAHTAENYLASPWTVKIDRLDPEHSPLHTAISILLKPLLSVANFSRLSGEIDSISDYTWVDKLPTPQLMEIKDEFIGIVDAHIQNLQLRYSWSLIRENLHACHMYLTSREIMIRPLIPPTWTHQPFSAANQRIFMSATLGPGGDLERVTGRRNITRLPIPEGWDKQGIGRRFFMFPEMSLNEKQVLDLQDGLIKKARRGLIIVPKDRDASLIRNHITTDLKIKVFNADDIEKSKKTFVNTSPAVAVVANRYDGIDFPGEDCRLLFVQGLPRATNSQERFLIYRMGANILFNERIQTRMLQAIGRCTRSLEDYSAVIVTGEELQDYFIDPRRRSHLHPELQAEIYFGIEQSKNATIEDFLSYLGIFLDNGSSWEEANREIVSLRSSMNQTSHLGIDALQAVVENEIIYQEKLWQGDYIDALGAAERVLEGLKGGTEIQGYRALWHYLAGSSAYAGDMKAKAQTHYKKAKVAAPNLPWLVLLSKYQSIEQEPIAVNSILQEQIEKLETILVTLGISYSKKYDLYEMEILNGININSQTSFEKAHLMIGELLGFTTGKVEKDGSPDPWWIAGNLCIVFEDNANAKEDTILTTKKARQASTHPNWIRWEKEIVPLAPDSEILPVLVTPSKFVSHGAAPHIQSVSLWALDDFKSWVKDTLVVIRELRRTLNEPGDMKWRIEAAAMFEYHKLDAVSIFKKLKQQKASDILKSVKKTD